MPELPSADWGEKIPEIFYYAKWWISEYQVFVMIGTAIALAMALLQIIAGLFTKDDDDDGFDYREI